MDTQPRQTAEPVRRTGRFSKVRPAARRAAAAIVAAARRHGPALAQAALRPAAWLAGIAAVVLIGLALAPPVTVSLGCTPPPLATSATAENPSAAPDCVMFCQSGPSHSAALVGSLLHAAA